MVDTIAYVVHTPPSDLHCILQFASYTVNLEHSARGGRGRFNALVVVVVDVVVVVVVVVVAGAFKFQQAHVSCSGAVVGGCGRAPSCDFFVKSSCGSSCESCFECPCESSCARYE